MSEQQERAQLTLESIGDGVIATTAEGYIDYLNPTAKELTEWPLELARGKPIFQVFRLVEERTLEPLGDFISPILRDGKTIKNNNYMLSKHGTRRAVEYSAAPIRRRDGAIAGAVIVFHDVTSAQELSRQLSYQATHDALTGLINRHEFEHRLERTLRDTGESAAEHVLCYMDLDQFKIVNDTCGHGAGDELLRQISSILRDSARESDLVARLGGDEFAIVLEHCPLDQALRLADDTRQRVSNHQFFWEDQTFSVAVSIGIVALSEHNLSMTQVLSLADEACYAAKAAGRNRVHVYQPDDSLIIRRSSEMAWIAKLHDALHKDRFLLARQAIVPVMGKERGDHYEILIRLLGEGGKPVPADQFLSAAERFKLMVEIDRWVIRKLVEWFQTHPDELARTHTCSVNLSGHSLNDDRSRSYVHEQLRHVPNLAHKICFEITETAAIANLRRAREFIVDLKAFGCRFALDDFGKGMSSLAYLKNLPMDYLKIDGQFVKDITEDAIDRAMVEAVNQIGHVLGMQTIAEFVESEPILAMIRAIGVDYAQGYAMGRPVLLEP